MLAQAAMILTITAFVGLLFAAARSDVASFTIPNELCLAVFLLAPVFWWAASATMPVNVSFWHIVATGLTVFILGFALFTFGVIGGGDAKLMAALGFWMGPYEAVQIFFIIFVIGGVLALVMAASAYVKDAPETTGVKAGDTGVSIAKRPIPYGIAIAIGGWMYAGQLILNALTP